MMENVSDFVVKDVLKYFSDIKDPLVLDTLREVIDSLFRVGVLTSRELTEEFYSTLIAVIRAAVTEVLELGKDPREYRAKLEERVRSKLVSKLGGIYGR